MESIKFTREDIIRRTGNKLNLTHDEMKLILDTTLDTMAEMLTENKSKIIIELRNFGIKAVEARVLTLSPDQRNFTWSSTKRKVMTVPFDEHPYSALAAFFKTDEGLEIYKNIEKRLK